MRKKRKQQLYNTKYSRLLGKAPGSSPDVTAAVLLLSESKRHIINPCQCCTEPSWDRDSSRAALTACSAHPPALTLQLSARTQHTTHTQLWSSVQPLPRARTVLLGAQSSPSTRGPWGTITSGRSAEVGGVWKTSFKKCTSKASQINPAPDYIYNPIFATDLNGGI